MKMSVITSITEGELTGFLSAYNLGKLQSYQGITEGTVNTNYPLNIHTSLLYLMRLIHD